LPSENREIGGRGATPHRGKLSIVGIGPGPAALRTKAASSAILSADCVVGYRPYLELISDLLPGKAVYSSGMGREVERVKAAVDLMERGSVALVSSGDANVYGMAGLGLEMAPRPEDVEVIAGVTSFTAAACRAGLFFKERVAAVSLSNLLTPWPDIEARLRLAGEMNMPVALYNPRSRKRDWQLLRALELLGSRDVLIARNVGREGEEIFWSTTEKLAKEEGLRERIDMFTLLILSGRGAFLGRATAGQAALNLVGIGPGNPDGLTFEAEEALRSCDKIFGANRYLDLIAGCSPAEKVAHSGPFPERMAARMAEAQAVARTGGLACILTGGDPSIFSSGWRIMDGATTPVHICPGVSAFSTVAARAGAPLVNDFALLSSPCEEAARLAAAGYALAVYNVRGEEISPLLQGVDPNRPVALAQDVARNGESILVLSAGDLLAARPSGHRFTLLLASKNSHIREGRIITKRGYDSKYSY